jgi:hypothetical protein
MGRGHAWQWMGLDRDEIREKPLDRWIILNSAFVL